MISLSRSELYIGNTSPDMTDMVLKDFLSSTMQKVKSHTQDNKQAQPYSSRVILYVTAVPAFSVERFL